MTERRNLRDLAEAVNKATKKQVAIVADGLILSDVSGYLSLGSWALDLVVGGGSLDRMGMPEGRIIEIFGEESTGKSTLMVELFKSAIAAGGDAVLIDSEAKFNKDYAAAWGLDLSRVITLKARTIEEGFTYIATLIEKCKEDGSNKLPLVIGWDTIAAAATDAEMKSGVYGGGMADKARVLHSSARRLAVECMESRVTLVCVNQVYDSMGGGGFGGPTTTTPGGRAIKYGASVRLDVSRRSKISEQDSTGVWSEKGAVMAVKLVKAPFNQGRKVQVPYLYHKGIDNPQGLHMLVWQEMCNQNVAQQGGGGWCRIYLPDGTEIPFRSTKFDEIFVSNPGVKDLMFVTANKLLCPPGEDIPDPPNPDTKFWVSVPSEDDPEKAVAKEVVLAEIMEMLDDHEDWWKRPWVMTHDQKSGWKLPEELQIQHPGGE